jgi:hypothetical protein
MIISNQNLTEEEKEKEKEKEKIMSSSSSMMRLCSLDPPKYGWTACGGVSSILEPHEVHTYAFLRFCVFVLCVRRGGGDGWGGVRSLTRGDKQQ